MLFVTWLDSMCFNSLKQPAQQSNALFASIWCSSQASLMNLGKSVYFNFKLTFKVSLDTDGTRKMFAACLTEHVREAKQFNWLRRSLPKIQWKLQSNSCCFVFMKINKRDKL